MNIKKELENIKANIKLINDDGITDPFKIEITYLERFPEQYDKFPFLIKKLVSGDDISMLEKMLTSLSKIDNGADKFKEEVKLGKILEKEYIKTDE